MVPTEEQYELLYGRCEQQGRGLMRKLPLVLFVAVLTGCASGYSQYFTRYPGATPERIAAIRVNPAPAVPVLERTDQSPQSVGNAYARQGYAAIGYSSFNSGHNESDAGALKQGEAVGADLVVVMSPRYAGSVTTSIPITTPTTQTSYTSGTATAYGSNGGSATAYGNSATTTYGSKTSYIPMTVRRQDFGAMYFVKRKYIFGANWRDLTNKERRQIQSNSGVYITSVVDDTPAFKSNVLVGDIILTVNGQSAGSQEQLNKLFGSFRGQTVELSIERGSHVIQKSVTLLR